jgi:hypothetical protein
MPFGSARQQFLTQAAPDEPSDDFTRLLLLADKVAGPDFKKRLADLKAATAAHNAARAAAKAAQRKADADLAAHAAVITQELKEHQAAIARGNAEIEVAKKAAAVDREAAREDRAAAAALKAEQQKRLDAVERAVAGA